MRNQFFALILKKSYPDYKTAVDSMVLFTVFAGAEIYYWSEMLFTKRKKRRVDLSVVLCIDMSCKIIQEF